MPPSVLTGRIVGAGPLWTDEDTDLALALVEMDAERCDGCGHSRLVSMDPDHEFAWQVQPLRCHACAVRDRATRAAARDDAWDDAGIRWIAMRRLGGDG